MDDKKVEKTQRKRRRIDDSGRECTKCGEYKPWEEYGKSSKGARGHSEMCRPCCREYHNTYNAAHREQTRQYSKNDYVKYKSERTAKNLTWRINNPEKVLESARKYRANNVEACRIRCRGGTAKWAAKYPEKAKAKYLNRLPQSRAVQAKRRALKLNAMPPWADHGAISTVFKEARHLTKTTGIQHHVDHIIPLVHPLVCGLHIPTNLRTVTASVNHRKSNKFDTDLYETYGGDLAEYYAYLLGDNTLDMAA